MAREFPIEGGAAQPVYIVNPTTDAADFIGLLLKTSQTTQYSSELDDGFYERGIAKSYTILTTGQYAGTTNITVNAKTDVHSNNCVRDEITGLVWSRYVSASVGPGNDGKMAWTGQPDDIFAYCAAANAAGLAGYADWRVPNVFELISLADFGVLTHPPDLTAFPSSWSGAALWSSTTDPDTTTSAMYIRYLSGRFSDTGAKAAALITALVRGG